MSNFSDGGFIYHYITALFEERGPDGMFHLPNGSVMLCNTYCNSFGNTANNKEEV